MSESTRKPLTTLLSNFIKEGAKFLQAGMPVVKADVYTERMRTCYECPELKENLSCGLCGCNMEMKAKWGTASCPATPPKWGATHDSK
jgi:hypothetical protein|tara:strand:+ start:1770 stop:2033 length:264 start_codon:yes stop_codon:yes gene_type:complete